MKFKDLSNVAKIRAVYDYLKGWLETHPEETFMDYQEVHDILIQNNESIYTKSGKYKGEV